MHWRFELRVRLAERLTDQQLAELMDSAARSDRDVARDPVGLSVVANGPSDEPGQTLRTLWVDVPSWLATMGRTGCVVSGQVMTDELAEEEATQPDTPELVAAAEVAEILGVSRQRVHQLAGRTDFPAPYVRLGAGPIWTRPAVETFQRGWNRRSGRRPGDRAVG